MKKIYKYKLETEDIQTIDLRLSSTILHINTMHNNLYLWALIDTDENDFRKVEIETIPTGATIEEDKSIERHYIGTCITHKFLVWHFFERRPINPGVEKVTSNIMKPGTIFL